jgi:glycosyltransferase involved in cell wall biosynthesis/ubiquinone/menaquinone biosynthesis C-methylase UbiE
MHESVAEHQPSVSAEGADSAPRIGILVVAYNAASTLAGVLDRVPKSFRPRISQVFVCDDASDDSTYLVGLGYKQLTDDLPLTVIRHPSNLGYGGNQKAGYRLAIEHGLDIIVLLHGDGQYAPECLPEIVAPLQRGECDAVLGSRMMVKGAARRGGMPLYKYLGNKILTALENRMLRTSLSEFHSGYRAYNVHALASLPFERNSDGFNFDTQIIIQLTDAGKRIVEVPIPTYYGDEICYVDGLRYARDVSLDVVRYRLGRLGFASGDLGGVGEEYHMKEGEESSHTVILRWLRQIPPSRLLDLGCSGGRVAEEARKLGHHVTGVDILEFPEVGSRVDRFIQANLDDGLPEMVMAAGRFDIVLAADVLEHVRQPEKLLSDIRAILVPRGVLIASVPNFGHWYARGRVAFGLFDYDQRGVLDEGHVRFFTRRGILRRMRNAGFSVVRYEATGLPLEIFTRSNSLAQRLAAATDRFAVRARPTLFGYQFVMQCESPPRTRVQERSPATDARGPHVT